MTQVWTPMILSSNGGEWLPVELDDSSEIVPRFEEDQDYPIGAVRMRLFDLVDPVVDAVLNLHAEEPMGEGQIIGPYCSHCISPIDGGSELYPCKTVRAVLGALKKANRG